MFPLYNPDEPINTMLQSGAQHNHCTSRNVPFRPAPGTQDAEYVF